MFKVKTYNKIDPVGLNLLNGTKFDISDESKSPDFIICRSQNLHDLEINNNLKAIGRAGAGVNNIPIDKCIKNGVVVFNTPGANANAVKELVISGMLISARNIYQGIRYVSSLDVDNDNVAELVEKNKSKFKGTELKGKKLGVIGLGAIGIIVANYADKFGLDVIGYDPYLTVNRAWGLSSNIQQADSLKQILTECDFISFHMPLNDTTKHFLDSDKIKYLKKDCTVLNFSRSEIVDTESMIAALKLNKIYKYVSDFPTNELIKCDNYLGFPHLGASTKEAEQNCAKMIGNQIYEFAVNGNIINSVNFPNCSLPRVGISRLVLSNKNIPNMVGQITSILADNKINILEMLNKSKGDLAYTILDLSQTLSTELIDEIKSVEGVYFVRYFN
jgi:D-3-phosphoglycerate dehydrogenase / 2-oxoglutarate reductase